MKNIGIICEGPTDYIILKGIVDKITNESNYYIMLQPEPDLTGRYGNGWKGVWKWCADNAAIKEKIMKNIEPELDFLIIQMDGDVSRKEKAAHCWCENTVCEYKGIWNPIECDIKKETKEKCPVVLPCINHENSIEGKMEHLEKLIGIWLNDVTDTCIVIPCDSTEAWIIAAYDELEDAENIENPWENIIAKGKMYHSIRIPGSKKRKRVYEQFVETVCSNWKKVTELCTSAKQFEDNILLLVKYSSAG